MRSFKDLGVIAVGALAAIYLVNPTAGLFEFIPDIAPIVGNLDEATATVLLVSAFRYFGVDPSSLFIREKPLANDAKPRKRG